MRRSTRLSAQHALHDVWLVQLYQIRREKSGEHAVKERFVVAMEHLEFLGNS